MILQNIQRKVVDIVMNNIFPLNIFLNMLSPERFHQNGQLLLAAQALMGKCRLISPLHESASFPPWINGLVSRPYIYTYCLVSRNKISHDYKAISWMYVHHVNFPTGYLPHIVLASRVSGLHLDTQTLKNPPSSYVHSFLIS